MIHCFPEAAGSEKQVNFSKGTQGIGDDGGVHILDSDLGFQFEELLCLPNEVPIAPQDVTLMPFTWS